MTAVRVETRLNRQRSERLADPRTPRLVSNRTRTLAVWMGSRLLLIAVVIGVHSSSGWGLSQLLSNWDVQHYETIARSGYANHVEAAFFPGLPLLLRTGRMLGIPYVVTGVTVALAGSLLAALALDRIGGWIAAALWCFTPLTIFTAVPYTEAPFCAAAFWAWERARAGRWWPAAVLTAVGCSLRISGLFLVIALAVMAVTTPPVDHTGRRPPAARTDAAARSANPPDDEAMLKLPDGERPLGLIGAASSRLVPLLLPTAVLAGWTAYLHRITGSWHAWLDAQTSGWQRNLTSPWDSLLNTLAATDASAWPGRFEVAVVFRCEVVSMLVGTTLTVVCLVRRRWPDAAWVGLQVGAFAISYWYMSVNRAVILWFPLSIALAELVVWRPASERNRWWWIALQLLVAVIDLIVVIVWARLFLTQAWAS